MLRGYGKYTPYVEMRMRRDNIAGNWSENAGCRTGESCKEVKGMLNEKSTIKELEEQARNTKLYIDRVVQAATGMTLEEIHRAALQRETDRKDTTANGAER